MADIPDTVADTLDWKALPVPAGPVKMICQGHPIRVTFKATPAATIGFRMNPGDMITLAASDAGYIRPETSLGGVAVFEDFG